MTAKPVDPDALASLPQELRCRVIDAFAEAEAALRANDPDRSAAATEVLTNITAELEQHHAESDATKFFKNMVPTRGDKEVLAKIADRASNLQKRR